MKKPKKIKIVTFKILEVNRVRAQRTDDYIRVEVFEDSISVGIFWQNPELIKKNKKRFGEDSYINSGEHRI